MASSKNPWSYLSSSVLGASHLKSGLPNQDAVLNDSIRMRRSFLIESDHAQKPIKSFKYPQPELEARVLLIADGHGSKRHFRSERGSSFAVESGFQAFHKFLFNLIFHEQLSDLSKIEAKIPLLLDFIYKYWQDKIGIDIAKHAFTAEQNELIDGKAVVAYGSTLLAVLAMPEWILYLQLGDGDILTVNKHGKVTHALPPSPEHFANETTSLCQPDALEKFQWRLQPVTDVGPAMVIVSTDGYSNSFRDDEGFMKAGQDFFQLMKDQGDDYIRNELATWLSEMTAEGSGDDITLGLLYRDTVPKPAQQAVPVGQPESEIQDSPQAPLESAVSSETITAVIAPAEPETAGVSEETQEPKTESLEAPKADEPVESNQIPLSAEPIEDSAPDTQAQSSEENNIHASA